MVLMILTNDCGIVSLNFIIEKSDNRESVCHISFFTVSCIL